MDWTPRMAAGRLCLALLAALASGGCAPPEAGGFAWDLPAHFFEPPVPASNPLTEAKVELGRHLFHDVRLSLNQTQACASCHQPALAFTDGKARAVGSTGEVHTRGALSLTNAAWRATYNWSNSLLHTLEQQALVPLFNVDPISELGMDGREDVLLARLEADPVYPDLFTRAFPGEPRPIRLGTTVEALVSFVRTIASTRAPYDRYLAGDPGALSASARRGLALFEGKARCAQCHSGVTFTDAQVQPDGSASVPFHIEGLYDVDGQGGYPASDQGLFIQTGDPADVGKFRTPTLRNIAVTGPYMHDGSLSTLAEVIAHYADGFSLDAQGNRVPLNPRADPAVQTIRLDAQEREDLEHFLHALTDQALLEDPRYRSPFGP